MDDLLDHFVLGLAPCHHPLLPASAARRETSAMKALLTAYQHGAARQDLLDALARRRFFQIPPELMAVGLKILHRLPHMPTPYFEAKPRRLVSLREFTGAVAPRNLAYDLRKALRAAGLALRLFDPGEDGNAQATAVRAMAFRLGEEAGEWQASVTKAKILFSAPRARSTPVFPCRPKSGKPGDAPRRGGHAVILFTKHQMLRGRIPLTCEAVPHAV